MSGQVDLADLTSGGGRGSRRTIMLGSCVEGEGRWELLCVQLRRKKMLVSQKNDLDAHIDLPSRRKR